MFICLDVFIYNKENIKQINIKTRNLFTSPSKIMK